ncbi:CD209 antigen-like protein D isoform X2 [Acipenser oxyrinchus oxyrinchus]|uniref:CD209 antigen-like protein D isoform X2 n=1 Tax=Acipenser oxyrinchus oxyrinchus TaxID=40147 RepID=A0AAD8CMP9_ACIOX|nr:CD209 antigen-like protein D isoform X2 [Acipenser oxyrinchus oxyrinchus]
MADSNDFEHFDFHQQTAQRKYQDRKRNCGSDMEEGKPTPMKTKDRNVCGSNSIVVLYILLMATSMVWMFLLFKAFAKHSEISAEIENLRNSRTILKGNGTSFSLKLKEAKNRCLFFIFSVTEEIRNLRVEQTLMKEKVCVIKTCPCEWTLFSGKCYYFSNENRDWKKAREFCQSQDSDLTVINSDEELNYLKGRVRVAHLVGMSDLETEGVWKWLDGSLVDGRMWNPGEPNNQGVEDCGEMSNGKMNDIPCNQEQQWICEKTL